MTLLPTALPLVARSSECTTGQQCSGCQASGCSDSVTSSIASSTASDEPVRTIITLTTIPQPTGASSTSTTTILSSRTAAEAMSSASPSQTPKATPSPNNTPVILGIVFGIVGGSLISILIWFFWRKKVQKRARVNSTSSSFGGGKEGKDFEMGRQISFYENQQHLQPEDGRGAKNQAQRARSLSRGSYNSNSAIGSRSATPALPAETEEKQAVPFPKAQRAAYYPIPGRSPDIPSWRNVEKPHTPGIPLTPMTPMHHHSLQQTSHPAYHVLQLSQHPAFRGGKSSPRPTPPPTWTHPAFRPEGTPHQLDSTPINPQNELDGGLSYAHTSPRVESLRNGGVGSSRPGLSRPKHSSTELPAADVPRSLFSNANTYSEPNMKSRYETPSQPCSQASSPATPFPQIRNARSHNVLSRDNSAKTGISTYTIPIGLGVVDASPTIGVNPFSLPLQGREITSAPKAEKKRSNSPPPVLKSNMNDRDDHVLSWDSYGAGQLSGIGPYSSTGSERSRRQREIEQGIIARDRDGRAAIREGKKPAGKAWMSQERGSYGEIPETPMSNYTESWMERESWALR